MHQTPTHATFHLASGWLSPFYCDNRKTLAYPHVRTFVKDQLAAMIRQQYPEATAIAGVATGAIAQGALVADALNLPMCYVRAKSQKITVWEISLKVHCPKVQK